MKQIFVLGCTGLLLIGCGSNDASHSDVHSSGVIFTASWGDSRDSVKVAFASQGLHLMSDTTDLTYMGGTFEGYAVEQWVLTFSEDGAFSAASISIVPDSAGSGATVQGLEARLTESFGQPVAPLLWKTSAGDHVSSYMISVSDADQVSVRIEGMTESTQKEGSPPETPTDD